MWLETKSRDRGQMHAAQSARFLFAMPRAMASRLSRSLSPSRGQRLDSSDSAGSLFNSSNVPSCVPSRSGCPCFANVFVDGFESLRVYSKKPFSRTQTAVARVAGCAWDHSNTPQSESAGLFCAGQQNLLPGKSRPKRLGEAWPSFPFFTHARGNWASKQLGIER